MVKGVSIKFKSYFETVPKLLEVTKLNEFLKKHNSIVLKPNLKNKTSVSTPIEFTEAILQFCLNHKSPETQVYIAEGSDGEDTMQLFEEKGYKTLAEKYNVSLVDLNTAETEEVFPINALSFESIHYPKILKNSLVISIPKLTSDPETEYVTSLSNMLGAYPASHYVGFFSKSKNKIRKEPIRYAIHDIIRCKMPEVAIIDASEQGYILTGSPLEIDKQALKLLNREGKSVSYLNLINDSSLQDLDREQRKKEAQEAKAKLSK
ncbi:MAG: DUF362 domain-containing protein [Nanoarchaeota archaeon]|nr:DUF362 domain-containing protein [Nanoarchaeota archaeon]